MIDYKLVVYEKGRTQTGGVISEYAIVRLSDDALMIATDWQHGAVTTVVELNKLAYMNKGNKHEGHVGEGDTCYDCGYNIKTGELLA